jgi:hypothetical protein
MIGTLLSLANAVSVNRDQQMRIGRWAMGDYRTVSDGAETSESLVQHVVRSSLH